MPLSVFRGQRRPGWKWTDLDRLASLALQAYEDDLCPGCGAPRTYSMDPDAHRHYTAETAICHSCAVKDRAEQDHERRPPGQQRYAAPDRVQAYSMHFPMHVPPFHR